ncbi:MAG: response regulator transcription factor [Vicinamibacterales bacterium]
MPIRIAIADDHAIVSHGIKRLLDGEPDFEVVQCCTTGREAVAVARSGTADVLLLDVKMPGMSGIDVLRTLSSHPPPCAVVLLTAAISDSDVMEGLRLGARGIVLKESSPETLLDCLTHVSRGDQWIDREMQQRADEALAQRQGDTDPRRALTVRETEIVRMIAQGLRNKVIAERLQISEGTVKIHLHNVYEKLGLDGRLELMLYAQRQGLV